MLAIAIGPENVCHSLQFYWISFPKFSQGIELKWKYKPDHIGTPLYLQGCLTYAFPFISHGAQFCRLLHFKTHRASWGNCTLTPSPIPASSQHTKIDIQYTLACKFCLQQQHPELQASFFVQTDHHSDRKLLRIRK